MLKRALRIAKRGIGIILPLKTKRRALAALLLKGIRYALRPMAWWKSLKRQYDQWVFPIFIIRTPPIYGLGSISAVPCNDERPFVLLSDDGALEISGWAIDARAKDVAGGVRVIIDNQEHKADYGLARPDVAATLNNEKLLYTGFFVKIPLWAIGSGTQFCYLKILTKDRKAFYRTKPISITNVDQEKVGPSISVTKRHPPSDGAKTKIKPIAFYLPQYHPIPENDKWWGKGYTEWTATTRAVPQFIGHYQPHLPADLGFYDLRVPEVRQEQVKLAQEYGIHAFCYHHYWFHGKRVLDRPFKEVFESKQQNFPFCLCWANEHWTRRWDGAEHDLLIAQSYSCEDDKAFIRDLIPVFLDERYVRIGSRPMLIVYRADQLPEPRRTAELWRRECQRAGVGEIYLIAAQTFAVRDPRPFEFDAAVEFPPHGFCGKEITGNMKNLNPGFSGHVFDYHDIVRIAKWRSDQGYKLFRTVFPSWDNTARKKGQAMIFMNSSVQAYRTWLSAMCDYTQANLKNEEQYIFINAWNEWGEGCHLEPDQKHGHAYLQATKEVLSVFNG